MKSKLKQLIHFLDTLFSIAEEPTPIEKELDFLERIKRLKNNAEKNINPKNESR